MKVLPQDDGCVELLYNDLEQFDTTIESIKTSSTKYGLWNELRSALYAVTLVNPRRMWKKWEKV